MFSAIFVVLLGVISAGLVLAGVAFYASWDTQRGLERDLDGLLQKLR